MTRLLCLAAALGLSATAGAQGGWPLAPGQTVRDSLAGDVPHAYEVDLDAGQFVAGEVDQAGVDVVVWVIGPDPGARPLGPFDVLARGPEPFAFEAAAAGTHRVEVRPFRGAAGRYALSLRSMAPAETAQDRVRRLLTGYDGPDRPGVAVAAADGGEAAWSLALGQADVEGGTPMTAGTPLRVAGLSHALASHAVALLAAQGALDLDADLRAVLPGLPALGEPVTARDLILHRSRYWDAGAIATLTGRPAPTRADQLALLSQQRAPVPSDYPRYISTDYAVMASLVEAVAGRPFEAWTAANVFGPLGMADAVIPTTVADVPPSARYGVGESGEMVAVDVGGGGEASLGVPFASARDLARWLASVDTSAYGRVVAEGVPQRRGYTDLYVGGLGVTGYDGRLRYRRTMGGGGLGASVTYFPERRGGVAVLSNGPAFPTGGRQHQHDLWSAVWQIEEATFGDVADGFGPPPPPPPPPVPRQPTEDQLAPLAGRYVSDDPAAVVVVEAGPQLTVRPEGDARPRVLELGREPDGSWSFRGASPFSLLRFDPDGGLVVVVEGAPISFRRAD